MHEFEEGNRSSILTVGPIRELLCQQSCITHNLQRLDLLLELLCNHLGLLSSNNKPKTCPKTSSLKLAAKRQQGATKASSRKGKPTAPGKRCTRGHGAKCKCMTDSSLDPRRGWLLASPNLSYLWGSIKASAQAIKCFYYVGQLELYDKTVQVTGKREKKASSQND
eukprot:1158304-Pelagomonas_calceolata.AAC.3